MSIKCYTLLFVVSFSLSTFAMNQKQAAQRLSTVTVASRKPLATQAVPGMDLVPTIKLPSAETLSTQLAGEKDFCEKTGIIDKLAERRFTPEELCGVIASSRLAYNTALRERKWDLNLFDNLYPDFDARIFRAILHNKPSVLKHIRENRLYTIADI